MRFAVVDQNTNYVYYILDSQDEVWNYIDNHSELDTDEIKIVELQ
jgi:hypothetical protein